MLKRLKSPTIRRLTGAIGLRGLAIGAGIASSVAVARLGGADVKGYASTFAATSILVFTAVNLDLAQQTLRESRNDNELGSLRARLTRLWVLYAVITAIAVGITMLSGSQEASWVAFGAFVYLVVATCGVAANALSGPTVVATGAILQQFGMIACAALLASQGALQLSTVPIVVVVSFLFPLPLYLFATRPRDRPRGSVSALPSIRLLKAGLSWQPARVAQLLLIRLDLLVVFHFLGAGSAGVYSVGIATAALAGIVPALFAANVTYEATQGTARSLGRNVRFALISGVATGVALVAVGGPLLTLAYGPAFSSAYPLLVLAVPGVIAYGLLQVFTNQMRLTGLARSVAVPSAVGVGVMAITLLVLLPPLDAIGAAIASSAGPVAAASLAAAMHYRRRTARRRRTTRLGASRRSAR